MEKLKLPTVVIERKGDNIEIKHSRTGMVAVVAVRRLDTWAVSQLRKELTPGQAK